jgi:hypothetical protein
MTSEAVRNRSIILELRRIDPNACNPLPSSQQLRELGLQLCAIALTYEKAALKLYASLPRTRFAEVNGRVVASYAVPAAIEAAVHGYGPESAKSILADVIHHRLGTYPCETFEAQLLRAILRSRVSFGQEHPPLPVSHFLTSQSAYAKFRELLAGYGVVLTEGLLQTREATLAGKNHICLAPALMQRHLVAGTRWARVDIDQVLARLPGAMRYPQSMAGVPTWSVAIPYSDWLERESDDTISAGTESA